MVKVIITLQALRVIYKRLKSNLYGEVI